MLVNYFKRSEFSANVRKSLFFMAFFHSEGKGRTFESYRARQ